MNIITTGKYKFAKNPFGKYMYSVGSTTPD
jgi:hypothetical protein